jgi:hypothetical protein
VPPDEKPSDTGEEEEMDYQYKKKKSIEEFDF